MPLPRPLCSCLLLTFALASGCASEPVLGGGGTSSSTGGGAGGAGGQTTTAPFGGGSPIDPSPTAEVAPAGVAFSGGVVIGVTNQIDPAAIPTLHVVQRIQGAVTSDQTLHPVEFPLELSFLDRSSGDEVEVGLDTPGNDPVYLLPPMSQLAGTSVTAGKVKLLRVAFSWPCAFVTCDPGSTCSGGACRDAHVPPAVLEDYTPDWASYSYCKPKEPGAPELALSAGSTSFVPIHDLDTVHLVEGPQGGHHIWIALRMRHLQQTSAVTLTGHVPGLDLDVGPQMFTTFFSDNPLAEACDATYIPLQVDLALDYTLFLGQEMQIKVHVEDGEGAKADDARVVTISPDVVSQ